MPVTYLGNRCRLVMSMGNFLRGTPLRLGVMAASNQPVGVDHLTIVPENFEAGSQSNQGGDEDDSAA